MMVVALKHNDVVRFFEKEGYHLQSEYINCHTKMEIKCSNGCQYQVTWANFKQGHRCPYCAGRHNNTTESIRATAAKEGYKLLSEYRNVRTKLDLQCPKGHLFSMTWSNFGSLGQRCPTCYRESLQQQTNISTVSLYMAKESYHLLSKQYVNNYSLLKVKCPKGHIFCPKWANYKAGTRCPICKQSKGERKLGKILEKIFPKHMVQSQDNLGFLGRLRVDHSIPTLRLAFEYDGEHHFMPVQYGGMSAQKAQEKFIKQQHRDKKKDRLCQQNGIKLIRFKYHEPLNLDSVARKVK